jgi:hypothetical protein
VGRPLISVLHSSTGLGWTFGLAVVKPTHEFCDLNPLKPRGPATASRRSPVYEPHPHCE